MFISRLVCSLLTYFTHVNVDNDVYAGPVAYCNSRPKRVVVNKLINEYAFIYRVGLIGISIKTFMDHTKQDILVLLQKTYLFSIWIFHCAVSWV